MPTTMVSMMLRVRQVSHDVANVAGNPWFICSCWAAQHAIARATNDEQLHAALPLMQWVVDRALPSGILAEQIDPYSNAPLSVSPLTWSHAEFIATVRWYVGKHQRLALHSLLQDQSTVASAAQGAIVLVSGHLAGEPKLGWGTESPSQKRVCFPQRRIPMLCIKSHRAADILLSLALSRLEV